MSSVIGRYSEINDIKEISELKIGMDFRLPEYRREVFLRFYGFHLKYKSHPGGVYFMLDALRTEFNLSDEDMYWIAFINGVTQHIVSTWVIFCEFKSFRSDPNKIQSFINDNWSSLGWDMDRRYVKAKFGEALKCYQELIPTTQSDYFSNICKSKNYEENFRSLWGIVINKFSYFGRLSTFSYLEYLKIIGLNIECDSLFLDDLSGSKSHRNGLSLILGRDDLDWHKSINPSFVGYSEGQLEWLESEGEILLNEARDRFKNELFVNDVSYFTLESTMCCYKSWFRPNRRYPNVYMDMMYERIKKSEESDKLNRDFSIFWKAREKTLDKRLLLEYNSDDPGLSKIKQNHFRETGEVIMIDIDYPCFTNSFNKNTSLEAFFN
jgi:hypothetical protein